MVDLSFLKKELEKVSSSTTNQDSKWKPPTGKSVIHFLSYKYNEDFPFRKLRFHYSLSPSVYCLENDEEGTCPICKAASKFWQDGKDDPDARNLAKKLFAKDRYYTPAFVRTENGKEVNEVRIWGFGKQLYKQILDLYDEHEMDLTDPKNAPDFTIKFDEPAEGESFGKTTITVVPSTIKVAKPIASSKKEIDAILDSVPQIETLFVHRSVKEVMEIFSKYLNKIDEPSEESSNKTKVEKLKRESVVENEESEDEDDLTKKLNDMFDEDNEDE